MANLQDLMIAKANELFALCDLEQKGYITRSDMLRLKQELPLSEVQLQHVFDSLDDDGNGQLSHSEFTSGFGSFLGMTPAPPDDSTPFSPKTPLSRDSSFSQSIDSELPHGSTTLDVLPEDGAYSEERDLLRTLYARLRNTSPDALPILDSVLQRVFSDIGNARQDLEQMESALKNRTSAHDDEMRRVYEEMESQLRAERERMELENERKQIHLKRQMEVEILNKTKQIDELIQKHTALQRSLSKVSTEKSEHESAVRKLESERNHLEEQLAAAESSLSYSQKAISELRQQNSVDKRQRVMSAMRESMDVALERDTLIQELDRLREENKQLLDEKDEHLAVIQRQASHSTHEDLSDELIDANSSMECQLRSGRSSLVKQGSLMGEYFNDGLSFEEDPIEVEVDAIDSRSSTPINTLPVPRPSGSQSSDTPRSRRHISEAQSLLNSEDEQLSNERRLSDPTSVRALHGLRRKGSSRSQVSQTSETSVQTLDGQPNEETSSPSTDSALVSTTTSNQAAIMTPERVFKVVFVGDSGVGKSSFIHRLCRNEFRTSFTATIGVDFQMKSLQVNGCSIAMQLWDTAGQERFRSITKQYFRKADGIVIMYDVVSEPSFLNVRQWAQSAKEGSDDASLLFLGNKSDLITGDGQLRAIPPDTGRQLAEDHGGCFFEVSASSGEGVEESIQQLAKQLSSREDHQLEVVKLEATGKLASKSTCC